MTQTASQKPPSSTGQTAKGKSATNQAENHSSENLPSFITSSSSSTTTTASVISTPPSAYLRLKPLPSTTTTTQPALDPTSLRLSLLNSLSVHLGDCGAAIPIDILRIDDGEEVPVNERGAVVRVPRGDALAVSSAIAAVGGLRVERRADWLDGLVAPVPKGLFDFGDR